MAFQLTDTVYKVDPEKLKEIARYCERPSPLLYFYGRGDDYCAQMEPLVQQLQDELKIKVKKFEVWHDSKNVELLQKLDPARCGGVPFFYNKASHRWICGATTYSNLKAWGAGTACDPFCPPENIEELQGGGDEEEKGFGAFVGKLKAKAQEKMAQQKEAREGGSDKKK